MHAMSVRLAVSTLACVSTAPRGTTSTAAVEMTAKGASGATSTAAGSGASVYSAAKGVKPGPAGSPN